MKIKEYIKAAWKTTGKYTKAILKTSFVFIAVSVLSSLICFLAKERTAYYYMLFASEELFEAAKACAGLGFIATIIMGITENANGT